jgi:hypothetical protein
MSLPIDILALPAVLASREDVLMRAVRRLNDGGDQSGWVWLVLGLLAATVAAGVASAIISRRRTAVRRQWAAFYHAADNAGLSKEERALLAAVATLNRARAPVEVFTIQTVFERGIEALQVSSRMRQASGPQRAAAIVLLNSMRDKLGFHREQADDEAGASSSRQIAEGARIAILHRGQPDALNAVVLDTNSGELIVQPEAPVSCAAGESWLVRYSDGGSVWEFDAPVLSTAGGRVVLGHADHVRFINRRRFPRVPVDRVGLVGAFPFLGERGSQPQAPQMVAARITEIAGPGLKLCSSLAAQAGQKVLVVAQFSDGRVVQGVAKVRRAAAADAGATELVVELIALSPADVAELATETNAAAQAHARATGKVVAPEPEMAGAA